MIARDLSEKDYKTATGFIKHTCVPINFYKEYQKWGSISKPYRYGSIGPPTGPFREWYSILTGECGVII